MDTIRLFLCLPPERAIELGLTHLLDAGRADASTPQANLATTVVRKLLRDLECVGSLLEALARGGAGEVSSRLAAVKWLLLTVLPEREAAAMMSKESCIDEATVQELVRAKVMLCPGGREELLKRVVSIMVGLDGGDVLSAQHEIRQFLLATTTPLTALLHNPRSKIGRSVVSFLFSPDHTEQLKRKEIGHAVVESFEQMYGFDVLHWQAVEAPAKTQPHRITAAAHAAVLERAPGPRIARQIANGPLLIAVSELVASEGAARADAFLADVLDSLPPGADTLVLAVLETLASSEPPACKVMAQLTESGPLRSARNPFLPELFAALRRQDLGPYLNLVASHGEQEGRPLQLALDGSPAFQALYVRHCRKLAGSAAEATALHIHNLMLDDTSCAALFGHLCAATGGDSAQDIFLLWYCWGRSPDRQLPMWALPRGQGNTFTLALNGGRMPFVERCHSIGAGISVLAKYLVAPESLPLGVYNTLATQAPWVHSDAGSAIKVETLLLGQEDCADYPPYCLRWHGRALPAPLRERLLRRCHEDVAPLADHTQHHFYPRVDAGVNEQNFRHNLGLLQTLTQDNEHLQPYFDHGSDGQRQFIAACIKCWFKAAGFDFADLFSCVKPERREYFKSLWADFSAAYKRDGPLQMRRMYVRGPLPTNIDVRWVEEGAADVPIFAKTRDSALLTAQWLNMLDVHFGLESAPFSPEDLVRVSGPRGGGITAGPRLEGALEDVSRAVGGALSRLLAADAREQALVKLLPHEGEGQRFDSLRLVTKVAVLTDFIAVLRNTPGSVAKFFGTLAKALADVDNKGPKPEGIGFAALFDAFFLLLGLAEGSADIEELFWAYDANGLPVTDQNFEEMRWLHENFYGHRQRDGTVTPRQEAFSDICARITRFRTKPPIQVKAQRHFAKTVFVGERLESAESTAPPYLQQLHFQLLCDRPARQEGSLPGSPSKLHDSDGAVSAGGSLTFSLGRDDDGFFTATGEEGGPHRAPSGAAHRQWERPEAAETAWTDGCPVISAEDIAEIDASASLYLHAILRVRPGLQPILQRADKAESYFRLSGLQGQAAGKKDGEICKAFATNAEAWQHVDRAQGAVVALEGCYLRKAEDGVNWVEYIHIHNIYIYIDR